LYLSKPGIECVLGSGADELRTQLVDLDQPLPCPASIFESRANRQVAAVKVPLTQLPSELDKYDCRNNRLAATALDQIQPDIAAAVERYGKSRVAVVMGTSTSGIAESEQAVRTRQKQNLYPAGYHAIQGTLGGLGAFVASYLGTSGPVSTLSTACASSASAILSARRLMNLGLCDAVVVGGVDSLCEMTIQGFAALGALAANYSKPFCYDRDGINLGEAAAVFVLSREPGEIALVGGAASSDAHNISAPDPEGAGAFLSMKNALADAGLQPAAIDYLNLHGTGTQQNDSMESLAVNRLFGDSTPCSSTKSVTGHTLGASGALELAICWVLLTQSAAWRFPPLLYTKQLDSTLSPIGLLQPVDAEYPRPRYCLSNSFAFGGSNVSLIVGRANV
jgi:3-oxoacyl-[acyl-carrier-protein] synthase-1